MCYILCLHGHDSFPPLEMRHLVEPVSVSSSSRHTFREDGVKTNSKQPSAVENQHLIYRVRQAK